ncbi:hypothetical protein SNOG_13038 [Parastagonospora nodorum SN15]|uniref:Uncharacterized protein n=1 Tax=Phaeosphaeria nodorum (strain SN15 / ATCC MYA-4574 / FGSC 10173) TaxID=321614 RepID=Q0U5C6_PHANO|nr:hypothetical protein SNOG_13038 [Parastagonospora nodorum SN15]EAT79365.1 hypothetical protein SNOG_13038 [Parastagonospora nodorum SN15]
MTKEYVLIEYFWVTGRSKYFRMTRSLQMQ